jgi:4-hydroxybenzoate polyprenyltransferase
MGPKDLREERTISQLEENVVGRRSVFIALVESLRLHQWAKNLLIFVPLVLAGKSENLDAWTSCLLGFVALGVLASSTYLANDLWDLPHDRRHWSKCDRPLARGDLPVVVARIAVPLGLLLSFTIAISIIDRGTIWTLLVYLVLTLAYSLWLKRMPIIDVFLLAVLFTLRLIYGIQLAIVPASPWLLVFSMVIFTSLALAKRRTEVGRNGALGREQVDGRGYVAKDAPFLFGMGLATAAGAVLLMVLYLIQEAFGATFYKSPWLLWCLPALLFLWLGRIWLLVGRDGLDDDPLWFAMRDNVSLTLGGAMAIVFLLAWHF